MLYEWIQVRSASLASAMDLKRMHQQNSSLKVLMKRFTESVFFVCRVGLTPKYRTVDSWSFCGITAETNYEKEPL